MDVVKITTLTLQDEPHLRYDWRVARASAALHETTLQSAAQLGGCEARGLGLVTVTWAEVLSQGVAVSVTTCNGTRDILVTVMKLSRLQQWLLTYTDQDTGHNRDIWRDAAIYAEALANINQEWFSRIR